MIDKGSLPNACNAFHFPSLFEKRENFADQLNEVTWLSSHGTPWSQVSHSGPCHISERDQNFYLCTYYHQDNVTISIKIRNTWKWLQSHGDNKKIFINHLKNGLNDLWTNHIWSSHPTKLFLVDETIIVDIKDPKEINLDKVQSNILIMPWNIF